MTHFKFTQYPKTVGFQWVLVYFIPIGNSAASLFPPVSKEGKVRLRVKLEHDINNTRYLNDVNLFRMQRPEPLPEVSSMCASIDEEDDPNNKNRVTECSTMDPCEYGK